MATKSFIKDININGNNQVKKFIGVLEKAEKKQSINVELSRSFQKIKRKDLRKLFGEL